MAENNEKKLVEVTATANVKDDSGTLIASESATAHVDLGQSAEDAIAKFGDEIVYSNFVQQSVVRVQGLIRSRVDKGIKAGKDIETIRNEVQEEFKDWTPDKVTVNRKDPVEKAQEAFEKLPPEKQKELLKQLSS